MKSFTINQETVIHKAGNPNPNATTYIADPPYLANDYMWWRTGCADGDGAQLGSFVGTTIGICTGLSAPGFMCGLVIGGVVYSLSDMFTQLEIFKLEDPVNVPYAINSNHPTYLPLDAEYILYSDKLDVTAGLIHNVLCDNVVTSKAWDSTSLFTTPFIECLYDSIWTMIDYPYSERPTSKNCPLLETFANLLEKNEELTYKGNLLCNLHDDISSKSANELKEYISHVIDSLEMEFVYFEQDSDIQAQIQMEAGVLSVAYYSKWLWQTNVVDPRFARECFIYSSKTDSIRFVHGINSVATAKQEITMDEVVLYPMYGHLDELTNLFIYQNDTEMSSEMLQWLGRQQINITNEVSYISIYGKNCTVPVGNYNMYNSQYRNSKYIPIL